MKTAKFLNQTFAVDADLNLYVDSNKIPYSDMVEIAKEYSGSNRIHKPIALLFWTDVKNGNYSNWTK